MTLVTEMFPRIRQATPEDVPILQELAAADGHIVLSPTHVILKGEQMVGYVSSGSIPSVLVWMDTQRTAVRDSLAVENWFCNHLASIGARQLILPCTDKSPFQPFLKRVGYHSLGAVAYLKNL